MASACLEVISELARAGHNNSPVAMVTEQLALKLLELLQRKKKLEI